MAPFLGRWIRLDEICTAAQIPCLYSMGGGRWRGGSAILGFRLRVWGFLGQMYIWMAESRLDFYAIGFSSSRYVGLTPPRAKLKLQL